MPTGALRVLLVDRDPALTGELSSQVQAWGYSARAAHDVDAAIETVVSYNPDAILIGDDLPGSDDGPPLAVKIRANSGTRRVLLVHLADCRGAFAQHTAGFDVHIAKSSAADELEWLLAAEQSLSLDRSQRISTATK